jgi:hypothetical protein
MLGLCGHLAGDGLAVWVLHHTPLSDPTRQLGGTGVTRAPDAIWALYGVGPGGKKRELKDPERHLECLKLRRQEDAPDAPLRLELVPGDPATGLLPHYRLVGVGSAAGDPLPPETGQRTPSSAPDNRAALTDRQRRVLDVLRACPNHTATTPDLAIAAGLTGDQTGETLEALVQKRLAAPAGTGKPHARGSKPPKRWKATPLALAAGDEAGRADRLLREALGGGDAGG